MHRYLTILILTSFMFIFHINWRNKEITLTLYVECLKNQQKIYAYFYLQFLMLQKILIVSCILTFIAYAYKNPVQGNRDSPDPGVYFDGNFYYAVTTMGWDNKFFPIWKSKNLVNWDQVSWVFPSGIPSWTACCNFWAPQMHYVNGQYMIYYTARSQSGKLSIGVAYSNNPLGPYTDKGSSLMSNSSQGVIDATVAIDRQQNIRYLIYKVDGNAHGLPTPIYAIKLASNGLSVTGNAIFLFQNDQSWQKGITQAPWVVYKNNQYYIFYSGCGYHDKCYSIGVARASKLTGPYTKHSGPIFVTKNPQTNSSWQGPGHCSVINGPNGTSVMVYHAWPHNQIGTKRVMLIDQITWNGQWPKIKEGYPSETQQPNP